MPEADESPRFAGTGFDLTANEFGRPKGPPEA